jgi:hypothetical protein
MALFLTGDFFKDIRGAIIFISYVGERIHRLPTRLPHKFNSSASELNIAARKLTVFQMSVTFFIVTQPGFLIKLYLIAMKKGVTLK